jgi:predicted Zn-dependent peptidase
VTGKRDKSIIKIVHNRNKQTHLCLGFTGPKYTSPHKMPTIALASYLGGGMSSVLFQKIREDRGLAYSVYSFNDFYNENGVLGVYLGTDSENLKKATELVLIELRRMKKQKLTPTQLHTLKAHIKGHLILSQESPNGRMNRLARQEFMTGKYQSLKEIIKEIDSVTSTQIADMANLIFNEDNYAIAVLGPVDNKALDGII